MIASQSVSLDLRIIRLPNPGTILNMGILMGVGLANHVCFRLPPQPIDATQALNLSAGVSISNVLRGRSVSQVSEICFVECLRLSSDQLCQRGRISRITLREHR